MFVDHIRIVAKAGNGGHGSPSYYRGKGEPKGGPDGGDGGRGGDVILKVDPHTDNLKAFFYRPRYQAEPGHNGAKNQKTGRSGKDLVLKVPPGTVVYRGSQAVETGPEGDGLPGDGEESPTPRLDIITEEQALATEPVADLTEHGQTFVLCKGGKGGRGNVHFKSSTNRAPVEVEPGEPGEEICFYFELRKIADAGLVGFPNAGKSTLLRALSAAKPKVAAYPFTTLKPMVGVVEFRGFSRATIADIPGLIEGAHDNVGLGHEFLRHIMRCQLLIFVVDMAGAEDGSRHPVGDIELLRKEIKLYNEDLATRPWLIVANKMDLPESQANLTVLRQRFPKIEVIPLSGSEGTGLDGLKGRLEELIGQRPK